MSSILLSYLTSPTISKPSQHNLRNAPYTSTIQNTEQSQEKEVTLYEHHQIINLLVNAFIFTPYQPNLPPPPHCKPYTACKLSTQNCSHPHALIPYKLSAGPTTLLPVCIPNYTSSSSQQEDENYNKYSKKNYYRKNLKSTHCPM